MPSSDPSKRSLERYAESRIPTEHGELVVVVYRERLPSPQQGDTRMASEHIAIVRGDVRGPDVLCRVHSECWTSEVLGSQKCDCAEQLDHALRRIVQADRGVVVYLRQEGRGIGLGNKIRAYALQEAGHDTVEANLALGFAPDLRRYEQAAEILADLGVESVALMTNNPDKVAGLRAAGVTVSRREPHWVPASVHAGSYLEVKVEKMGHLEPGREPKEGIGSVVKLLRAR